MNYVQNNCSGEGKVEFVCWLSVVINKVARTDYIVYAAEVSYFIRTSLNFARLID